MRFFVTVLIVILISLCESALADTCFGTPSSVMANLTDTSEVLARLNLAQIIQQAKALLSVLTVIAILYQFFQYLKGQLDLTPALLRIFIFSLLLSNYSAAGNESYRQIIRTSGRAAGDWIKGGSGAEVLLGNISRIFNRTMGTGMATGNLSGIFDSLDTAAKLLLTTSGWITISFVFVSTLVAVLSFAMDAAGNLLLFILEILGPFCLAFGVLPATDKVALGWILRWIELSIWPLIYGTMMVAITAAYGAIVQIVPPFSFATPGLPGATCAMIGQLLAFGLGLVSIFMLSSIPFIASSLVSGRSRGFAKGVVMATSLLPNLGKIYVTKKLTAGLK